MKESKFKEAVLFSLFHSIFFTLLFILFRTIPGVDVGENFFWGQEFQLGYYKHPPLSALISGVFGALLWESNNVNYIICGTFIFASLISSYFFAREFVSEKKAFIAILLLEGLTFAGMNARVFNANLVQIPFWILSALFYWRGVTTQKTKYFCLFGIFLGFTFLGKYSALLLSFTCFASFVSNNKTRELLKTPMPYLAVLCFLITISPHIYWLIQNGPMTIEYLQARQNNSLSFFGRRLDAINYFFVSITSFIGIIIGFIVLFKNVKLKFIDFKNPEQNFLFCASVLPFLMSVVVVIIFGFRATFHWSTTFFFVLPVFLLYFFDFEERANVKKRLKIFITSMLIIWTLITIFSGIRDIHQKEARYKALREISVFHTQNWEKSFKRKLKFVAGSTIDAGFFYLFSSARPSVIPDNNLSFAPFIKQEDVDSEGYILLETCQNDSPCFQKTDQMEIVEKRDIKDKHKRLLYTFVVYVKPK